MSNSDPAQASEVEAAIYSNIPYQPVALTLSYQTASGKKSVTFGATTDGIGGASVFFNIPVDATISVPNQVQVSINNGEATCSTSLTFT